MTLPIRTITSDLKVLTYIITSITVIYHAMSLTVLYLTDY